MSRPRRKRNPPGIPGGFMHFRSVIAEIAWLKRWSLLAIYAAEEKGKITGQESMAWNHFLRDNIITLGEAQAFARGLVKKGWRPDPNDVEGPLGRRPASAPGGTVRYKRNPFTTYHGTGAKFAKFSAKKISGRGSKGQHGWGIYLTSDGGVARSYARERGATGRVLSVYVDADEDQFLRWEEPFTNQPEPVRRALQRMAKSSSAPGRLLKSLFKDMEDGETSPEGWLGRQFYSILKDAFTDDGRKLVGNENELVSRWLAKGGIVGASFADHTDAQDGRATNWVVFDLKKLRVEGEAQDNPRRKRRNPDDESFPRFGVSGWIGMANRWVTKRFTSAAAREAWLADVQEYEGFRVDQMWEDKA